MIYLFFHVVSKIQILMCEYDEYEAFYKQFLDWVCFNELAEAAKCTNAAFFQRIWPHCWQIQSLLMGCLIIGNRTQECNVKMLVIFFSNLWVGGLFGTVELMNTTISQIRRFFKGFGLIVDKSNGNLIVLPLVIGHRRATWGCWWWPSTGATFCSLSSEESNETAVWEHKWISRLKPQPKD